MAKATTPAKSKKATPEQASLPDTVKQENTALAASSDFEQFAGVGTENIGTNDILIPRLTILQDLSPQLKRSKPEYIEGAEVGQIADVGTGDVFPEGVLFLPVYYKKEYLEWAPRSSGKGLINVHPDDSILEECTKDDKGRFILDNGNYIAETAQWFGINLSAGRRKCFVPMASSQLKRSRKWMTMVTNERIQKADGSDFQAPIFYRSYMLATAEESNNDGDWFVWTVGRGAALPEMGEGWKRLMDEAVKFREALIKGEARADLSEDSEGGRVVDNDDGEAM